MSEDDDLERLRKKRLEKFQKRISLAKEEEIRDKLIEEEKKRKLKEAEESKLKIMEAILFPDAYKYYINDLKVQHPKVADKISNTLIYLLSQNQLQGKLSKNDLIILKRKILGIGPKIKVKFQGDKEAIDLTKKLREQN